MSDSNSDSIKGQLTDGKTAASIEVEVSVYTDSVIIKDSAGTTLHNWQRSELSVEHLPGGAVWISSEKEPGPRAYIEKSAHLFPEQKKKNEDPSHLVTYVIATLCLGVGIFFALPGVSALIANHIPRDIEMRMMGEFSEFFREKPNCNNESIDQLLRDTTKRLTTTTGDPQEFEVIITRDNFPNAFALPGGLILLTKALIEKAEGPDEVVGILAHEIAHVRKKHIMRRVVRQGILTAIWSVTFGDYTGFLVIDPDTAFRIATLKFSREQEQEADLFGARMMRDSGHSVSGMVAFFERLKSKRGDDAWFSIISTHPAIEERIAPLQNIAQSQQDTTPSLSEEDWELLRNACKLHGPKKEPRQTSD